MAQSPGPDQGRASRPSGLWGEAKRAPHWPQRPRPPIINSSRRTDYQPGLLEGRDKRLYGGTPRPALQGRPCRGSQLPLLLQDCPKAAAHSLRPRTSVRGRPFGQRAGLGTQQGQPRRAPRRTVAVPVQRGSQKPSSPAINCPAHRNSGSQNRGIVHRLPVGCERPVAAGPSIRSTSSKARAYPAGSPWLSPGNSRRAMLTFRALSADSTPTKLNLRAHVEASR